MFPRFTSAIVTLPSLSSIEPDIHAEALSLSEVGGGLRSNHEHNQVSTLAALSSVAIASRQNLFLASTSIGLSCRPLSVWKWEYAQNAASSHTAVRAVEPSWRAEELPVIPLNSMITTSARAPRAHEGATRSSDRASAWVVVVIGEIILVVQEVVIDRWDRPVEEVLSE